MERVVDLLDRPMYSMSQVDRLLALPSGTARRWIDGYWRRSTRYPPVVRPRATGSEVVTWGEFVETRLLAEYRGKGVPLIRMRPAITALREEFGSYPLAQAKPFVAGRELVRRIQDSVGLDGALRLVVARSGQLLLSEAADHFHRSVEFTDDDDGYVLRVHPQYGNLAVVIDPRRQFGDPVVRSVPTEVIAEEFAAGDSVESIAELYELPRDDVEAALRYEQERLKTLRSAAGQ